MSSVEFVDAVFKRTGSPILHRRSTESYPAQEYDVLVETVQWTSRVISMNSPFKGVNTPKLKIGLLEGIGLHTNNTAILFSNRSKYSIIILVIL